MNSKPQSEMIPEDEINLYDYWKVFVKRKKILVGVFFIPVALVTAVSFSVPRYYRGEVAVTTSPALSVPKIVKLVGDIDDAKRTRIFADNSTMIRRVSISIPPRSTNELNMLLDAQAADIISRAFEDMLHYISMLPEIKEEIARAKARVELRMEDADFRIKKLMESRKANLVFLKDLSDMIKKRQLQSIDINPADLIKKDADLAIEISGLQQAREEMVTEKAYYGKANAGMLGPVSITKQPLDSKMRQWILIACVLSLLAGIFIVLLLEHIERMKAREN